MNEMEKKIKAKAQERQSQLTPEEKKGIEELAKKLSKGAKEAQKKVLEEKGNGRVKKASKKAAPSTTKAPQPKATGFQEKAKRRVSAGEEDGLLTTKEVAAMVGTTPKALRRVLRAKWYDDKVTTNYRWTEDDPILQEILDYYATK